MTKDEIKKFLAQVKIMYPRFDAVEKEGTRFGVLPEVADAWYTRIGWMDFDRAIKILDDYMESDTGSRTPGIALWMANGKAQRRSEDHDTAVFDRKRGIIVWKPETEGKVFEIPVSWSEAEGCYLDGDGQRWATAGG